MPEPLLSVVVEKAVDKDSEEIDLAEVTENVEIEAPGGGVPDCIDEVLSVTGGEPAVPVMVGTDGAGGASVPLPVAAVDSAGGTEEPDTGGAGVPVADDSVDMGGVGATPGVVNDSAPGIEGTDVVTEIDWGGTLVAEAEVEDPTEVA